MDKSSDKLMQPIAKSIRKILPYNHRKITVKDKVLTLQNRTTNVRQRDDAFYMSYDITKEDTNIMNVLLSNYTHIFINTGDRYGRDKPVYYAGELVYPLDVLTASKMVDGFEDVTETYCEFLELAVFDIKGTLIICTNIDCGSSQVKYAVNDLISRLNGCKPCLVCSGSSVRDYHNDFHGDKYYLAIDSDEWERRSAEVRLRTTVGTDLEDRIGAITYSESDFLIKDDYGIPPHIAPAPFSDISLCCGVWRAPLKLKGLKSCAYIYANVKNQPEFTLLPTTVTDVSNMCFDKLTGEYVDGVVVERTDNYIKVQCKVLTINEISDKYVEQIDSAAINGLDYVRYTKYISRFSEGCYVYKVDISTLNCADDMKSKIIKDVLEEAKRRLRDPSTTIKHTACEEISPGVAYISINWSDTGD